MDNISKRESIQEEQFDFSAKVLIIGDSKVGKSSILMRYINDTFSSNTNLTVGIDFKYKVIQPKNSNIKIKMQLWDTAGQERFRPIVSNFYKNTKAAILVFDITDAKSLEDLKYWSKEIKTHLGEEIPKTLVGNKIDLIQNKSYSDETLKNLIQEYKMKFFQVSALSGENVEEPFYQIASLLEEQYQQKQKLLSSSSRYSKSNNNNNSIKEISDSSNKQDNLRNKQSEEHYKFSLNNSKKTNDNKAKGCCS